MADLEMRVSGLGGPVCTVAGLTSWSVLELKEAIEFASGIERRQQRLLLGTAELRNDASLADYFTSGAADVTLLQRCRRQAAWLRQAELEWSELLQEPEAAWDDREVVLAAASQCGWALAHAAERLRADREVVLAAVRQSGLALRHAAPDLAADREVALEAIAQCGKAFESAAPELRADRRFVLEAVQRNGRALEHVGLDFCADREIVLAAVRQCGCALSGAATQLRHDYELVKEAIKQDGGALAFAAAALRADPELRAQAALGRSKSGEVGASGSLAAAPDAQGLRTFAFGGGRSDGHAGMSRVLGRKGAHLCEMARLGLPVAPGFVLTPPGAQRSVSCIGEAVKEALAELERVSGRIFGSQEEPLLLSVSSGSVSADAGELANIGLNDEIAEAWASREGAHFVWDSYRRLIMAYARGVKGLDMKPFQCELTRAREALNAKCMLGRIYEDCDIPARDLKELVWIYQDIYQEQCGEPFPQDPAKQLQDVIAATFGKSPDAEGLRPQSAAAIVQAMVFGNYDSLSAVGLATLQAGAGETLSGEWLTNAQMDDIFVGSRKQQKLTEEASRSWAVDADINDGDRTWQFPSLEEQMPAAFASLIRCQDILRCHVKEADGVEFVVQQGQLYIRQPHYSDDSVTRRLSIAEAVEEAAVVATATAETDAAATTVPEAPKNREELIPPTPAQDGPAGGDPVQSHEEPPGEQAELQPGAASTFDAFEWPARPEPPEVGHRHFVTIDAAGHVGIMGARGWHLHGATGAFEPCEPREPALRLPLWQTAFAGGAAGFAASLSGATAEWIGRTLKQGAAGGAAPILSAGGLLAGLKAAPRGMVCTTCYVNFLSSAAGGGSLDSVTPLARLGCAAGAATVALTTMHAGSSFYGAAISAPPGRGGPLATLASGSRLAFSGLPSFLRANLPVMAIELCAIDIVKNLGTDAGFNVSPGLLLASGATAGAVSQSLLHPLGAAQQLAGQSGGVCSEAKKCVQVVSRCESLSPLFRGISASYLRSMPTAGANSLVRVGLVSQFLDGSN